MSTTDHCWTGSLEDMPVTELLEWLHEGSCTAMLRIGEGLGAGVVFFREGQLYRCEWGQRQGLEAVQALMQLSHGTFCLIQRQFPEPKRNVHVATALILGPEDSGARVAS